MTAAELDRAAARRHGASAMDVLALMSAGEHQAAADLLATWHAEDRVDPWKLALALAALAVKRPCGRAHPGER